MNFAIFLKTPFLNRITAVAASARIENADSNCLICKNLESFIEPIESSISGIYDFLGINFFNRLELDFTHLVNVN